jgi:hypothetical protein
MGATAMERVWNAAAGTKPPRTFGHEPPDLRERFAPYDRLPAIVRATLPAHAPKLLVQLLQSFSVLTR